jgi:hypothetical protein
MTTFKEIRGTAIQSVSTDPTNPETGQIWYNNTIGVLKGYDLIFDNLDNVIVGYNCYGNYSTAFVVKQNILKINSSGSLVWSKRSACYGNYNQCPPNNNNIQFLLQAIIMTTRRAPRFTNCSQRCRRPKW